MPCTARTPTKSLRRTVLVPLLSLALLVGLALVGPAAVAAPSKGSGQTSASAASGQTAHSAERKHKKKKKKKKHRRHKAKKRGTQSAGGSSRVDRAASIILKQVGDPYRYGAAGPSSFDCSGLIKYGYSKAGIKIPRTSSAQAGRAHRISRSKLRRGDLLYFTRGGRVYHTAMFVKWKKGSPQIVHAPGSGQRVKYDKPWTNSWFAGTMR